MRSNLVARQIAGFKVLRRQSLALERHERFTELKMRLLGDCVSRRTAWKIARQNGWPSTFDAEYLAVCELQADVLVAIYPTLAAKAKDIEPLAPLETLFTS